MVFGFQLSFARLGSTINFWVMNPIYRQVSKYYSGPTCLGIVLFLAATTCVGSLGAAMALGLMDKRAERILKRGHNEEPKKISLTDVKYFKVTFWLIAFICIGYYVTIFPFVALAK